MQALHQHAPTQAATRADRHIRGLPSHHDASVGTIASETRSQHRPCESVSGTSYAVSPLNSGNGIGPEPTEAIRNASTPMC